MNHGEFSKRTLISNFNLNSQPTCLLSSLYLNETLKLKLLMDATSTFIMVNQSSDFKISENVAKVGG